VSTETDSAGTSSVARQPQGEAEAVLRELRDQFEAYRKEKAENDSIMNQQLEEMRDQTSSLRLDNAKLASKVLSRHLYRHKTFSLRVPPSQRPVSPGGGQETVHLCSNRWGLKLRLWVPSRMLLVKWF